MDLPDESSRAQWTTLATALEQTVDLLRSAGVHVGLVYTPTAFQYDGQIGATWKTVGIRIREAWLTETSEFQRRTTELAERLRLPWLDLTAAFREAAGRKPGTLNYLHDGHWNAEGHALAAQVLADWFREQDLGLDALCGSK